LFFFVIFPAFVFSWLHLFLWDARVVVGA